VLCLALLVAAAQAATQATSVSYSITSTYASRFSAGTVKFSFTSASIATATTGFTITQAGGYNLGNCATSAVTGNAALGTVTACTSTGAALACTAAWTTATSGTAYIVTLTSCVGTPSAAVASAGALWSIVTANDQTSAAAAASTLITANTDSFALNSTSVAGGSKITLSWIPSGPVTSTSVMTIAMPSFTVSGAASTAVVLGGTSSSTTAIATTTGTTISLTMTGLSGSLIGGNTLTATLNSLINPIASGSYNVTFGTTGAGTDIIEYDIKTLTIGAGSSLQASVFALLALLALLL